MIIGTPEKPKRRWRFGLRGLMILVAVVAITLPLILRTFSQEFRQFERIVRVRLNEEDMNRHTNVNGVIGFADEFSGEVRAGRVETALQLTTLRFQNRLKPEEFRALIARLGLDKGPCQPVQVTTEFTEDDHRFQSVYSLRCGQVNGDPRWVKLVVITEGGRLRVDRIEPGEPVVVAP